MSDDIKNENAEAGENIEAVDEQVTAQQAEPSGFLSS